MISLRTNDAAIDWSIIVSCQHYLIQLLTHPKVVNVGGAMEDYNRHTDEIQVPVGIPRLSSMIYDWRRQTFHKKLRPSPLLAAIVVKNGAAIGNFRYNFNRLCLKTRGSCLLHIDRSQEYDSFLMPIAWQRKAKVANGRRDSGSRMVDGWGVWLHGCLRMLILPKYFQTKFKKRDFCKTFLTRSDMVLQIFNVWEWIVKWL